MRHTFKMIAGGFLLAGLLQPLLPGHAQQPERTAYDDSGPLPWFFTRTVSFLADDSSGSELRVGTQIAYDRLNFVKKDTLYQAGYELAVTVFDKSDVQAGNRSVRKLVKSRDFEGTNANDRFDTNWISFLLKPGEYRVEISLLDMDLSRTAYRSVKVHVPDFSKEDLSLSGLLFLDPAAADSAAHRPGYQEISGVLSREDSCQLVQFEIYTRDGSEKADLVYSIIDQDDQTVYEDEETVLLKGMVTRHRYRIRSEELEGPYGLIVETAQRKDRVRRTARFTLHYPGMPVLAASLEKAIEQLGYIASSEEMRMFKGQTAEVKKDKFFEFWADRDPSPTTPANELMEEYYRRVYFANRFFGKFNDGWKTDRGRVYIIMGSPDAVDRHPFEPNTRPYEIWYYRQVNREFVFVDEMGFGEYYLTTPHYDILHRRD